MQNVGLTEINNGKNYTGMQSYKSSSDSVAIENMLVIPSQEEEVKVQPESEPDLD